MTTTLASSASVPAAMLSPPLGQAFTLDVCAAGYYHCGRTYPGPPGYPPQTNAIRRFRVMNWRRTWLATLAAAEVRGQLSLGRES